jgi:hypothetical protein
MSRSQPRPTPAREIAARVLRSPWFWLTVTWLLVALGLAWWLIPRPEETALPLYRLP